MSPTRTVAALVRQIRDRRGWTAQQLADMCAEAGMPGLDRSTVANIENGRRQRIGIDELLTLAYVLDVAPVHLLTPRDDDEPVAVTPTTTVRAAHVRRWVRGLEPLPGRDDKAYRTEVPASEWAMRGERVRDAEDEVGKAWRRLRLAETRLEMISEERETIQRSGAEGLTASALVVGAMVHGDPALATRINEAYERIAEAKVDYEDAVARLRRVRAEARLDDGER